ncbi:hypothetical protein ACFVOR_03250 [Streptomyces sp. NPDC057837]|uniref:hypothetical protein n=1 Tax=Streptomyces sp. NPDC057837 TaxID=3346260 RepID=UPI0036C94428
MPREALKLCRQPADLFDRAADHVLHVDGKIAGVIEAEREGTPLACTLAQYTAGVLKEHAMAVWRREEPFAFRKATTGTETYFLNRVDPDARFREVFAFHRPEALAVRMRYADEHPSAPTFRTGPAHRHAAGRVGTS